MTRENPSPVEAALAAALRPVAAAMGDAYRVLAARRGLSGKRISGWVSQLRETADKLEEIMK